MERRPPSPGAPQGGPAAADAADVTRAIDPASLDRSSMYFLLNSMVVPRPIAWVSTVSTEGVANLAPHSYFTIAGVVPPTLLFVSIGDKDTVRNARDTGSFVVNSVDRRLAERMNVSAADAPPHVSEFELAGVTTTPGDVVSAPRVVEAPVSIECELDRIVEIGPEPSYVVLGTVRRVHLAERLLDERDRIDPAELDAVARMGGALYSTTADRFSMTRPKYRDLVDGADGTTPGTQA